MFPFEPESYPLADALGRAILHSLWQGAAVAGLLVAALSMLRGRGANARYALSCAALALMLVLPAATVWKAGGAAQDSLAAEEAAAGAKSERKLTPNGTTRVGANGAAVEGQPSSSRAAGGFGVRRLLPWLSLVWLTGVLLLLARMLGGVVYARRLGREGVSPVGEFWQERARDISRRLRLSRAVRVFESTLVQVPTAVGWLRPVVLLPASALVGLTPRQLETILAHELAHIRRHDYLFNLLQLVAETLLFYHPAAWWVSRRVRGEREHVCDDLAVRVCGGDALTYARALTRMERLRRTAAPPQVALAADGGDFTSRILRLVGTEPPGRRLSPLAVGLCFAVTLLMAAACTRAVLSERQRIEQVATGPASEPTPAAAQAAARGQIKDRFAADSVEGEDAEVRRAAVEALGEREGAVVVMDPRTGRVYTVVNQEWALRRGWAPASTMKLVVSAAGVGEKVIDPAERVRVAEGGERLDLTGALALSDNDYFRAANARVGAGRIITYARRLGLGEPTGINYEGEVAGRLPAAESVANAARLGFGEGIEVTPVQLAVMVSALANGGTLHVPQVPRGGAAGFDGRVRRAAELPASARAQVVAGMLAAVERGTASGLKDASLRIAGKTGTTAPRDSKEATGWFASYAPADDPRLTVVVLVAGEGQNGPGAAEVAGSIYRSLRGRL